jgi:hypothetical protein
MSAAREFRTPGLLNAPWAPAASGCITRSSFGAARLGFPKDRRDLLRRAVRQRGGVCRVRILFSLARMRSVIDRPPAASHTSHGWRSISVGFQISARQRLAVTFCDMNSPPGPTRWIVSSACPGCTGRITTATCSQRPNRTSELGNFRPVILRSSKPALTAVGAGFLRAPCAAPCQLRKIPPIRRALRQKL